MTDNIANVMPLFPSNPRQKNDRFGVENYPNIYNADNFVRKSCLLKISNMFSEITSKKDVRKQ